MSGLAVGTRPGGSPDLHSPSGVTSACPLLTDVATGRLVRGRRGHTGHAGAVEFSPEWRLLGTAGGECARAAGIAAAAVTDTSAWPWEVA